MLFCDYWNPTNWYVVVDSAIAMGTGALMGMESVSYLGHAQSCNTGGGGDISTLAVGRQIL